MSTFAMVNWRQVTRTALNPEQQTRSYIPTVKHSGVRDVVKRNYHIVTVLWSKPWICNRIPIWPQIKLLYRGQFSWKLVIDVHHRLHKSIMVGILRPLNDAALLFSYHNRPSSHSETFCYFEANSSFRNSWRSSYTMSQITMLHPSHNRLQVTKARPTGEAYTDCMLIFETEFGLTYSVSPYICRVYLSATQTWVDGAYAYRRASGLRNSFRVWSRWRSERRLQCPSLNFLPCSWWMDG